jgi:hypothetical protein
VFEIVAWRVEIIHIIFILNYIYVLYYFILLYYHYLIILYYYYSLLLYIFIIICAYNICGNIQVIAELAHLRSLPEVIDTFLRLLKPKKRDETDRDFVPRMLTHIRSLVAVSRLPVFSQQCPVEDGDGDAASSCQPCYDVGNDLEKIL